ncbi:MAG: hypothetical protein KGZ43_08815 [Sulfuritalea sp.]|nr:hypothetical protein [Sulfuritalea sp.]
MTDLSIAKKLAPYKPQHKLRFVTAASLFDGHDASINIMRRILQATGAEVIHLGHNRSVREVVNAALQEDVQGIAITSYALFVRTRQARPAGSFGAASCRPASADFSKPAQAGPRSASRARYSLGAASVERGLVAPHRQVEQVGLEAREQRRRVEARVGGVDQRIVRGVHPCLRRSGQIDDRQHPQGLGRHSGKRATVGQTRAMESAGALHHQQNRPRQIASHPALPLMSPHPIRHWRWGNRGK